MSVIIPTSPNQAQCNFSGCNMTVAPSSGSVDLFDGLLPTDILNGNSGANLVDLLKITEWFQGKLLKPSIWTNPSGNSAGWTKPVQSKNSPWTNKDAV